MAEYKVEGMHCASCAIVVKKELEKIWKSTVLVNLVGEIAQTKEQKTDEDIRLANNTLAKLGYKLVDKAMRTEGESGENKMSWELKISLTMTLASIGIMLLEMFFKFSEQRIPFLIESSIHHLMPVMATFVLASLGRNFVLGVWRFIRYGGANMDTLIGIGTGVAFVFSFVMAILERKESYYEVVIVVVSLVTLGKYLEKKAKEKTSQALKKLAQLQVKEARLEKNGKEKMVLLEQVMIGDVLIVKPGEKIPLDGKVIFGEGEVDESMVSGESLPVSKRMGGLVIGSSLNLNGLLKIKVEKKGSEGMLGQMMDLVAKAQLSKAPIEDLVDKVAGVFVPVVLVLAFVTGLVWIMLGNWQMALSGVVGILVIACPCALGLATPTAVVAGMGRAAEKGILIKKANVIEKLAAARVVVFDKTGTLTNGDLKIAKVISFCQMAEKDVLIKMASLEKNSSHPIAVAIYQKAKESGLDLEVVSEFKEKPGWGVEARINGINHAVAKIEKTEQKELENVVIDNGVMVGLYIKSKLCGVVVLIDEIRPMAKSTIADLTKMGVGVIMLTGDRLTTAMTVAKELGIEKVLAETRPENKAEIIKKLMIDEGKVVMVGDGINDAPALALAHVGVAMATGTEIAKEAGEIILLGGRIEKLVEAIKLTRFINRIIKENLFWAMIYNIIGIPIAGGWLYPLLGWQLSPILAGATMAFSSVCVVSNSLRLTWKK
jgi:Cu2+-exporting ATPase/Cu+-exporting ATPase